MSPAPVCRPGAVVFDLDGVLVDSIAVMRAAFQHAYGLTVGPGSAPFEDYLPHLGRHMPHTLELMGLPQEMYEPFVVYSRAHVHEVPVHAGAPELLAGLRARGVRLGVATGKTHERACQVLEATGLLPLLDDVAGSDEVEHGKPEPDLVQLAVRRLGVTADDVIMVGDSPLDLEAGRRAGTRVVAALWGQGTREHMLSERPDFTASSCADLAALLARLLAAQPGS